MAYILLKVMCKSLKVKRTLFNQIKIFFLVFYYCIMSPIFVNETSKLTIYVNVNVIYICT